MKTLPADLEALMPEPATWTLNEELQRRETTCKAHMWFVNPQNSSWAPLFTADQVREAMQAVNERAAKLAATLAYDAAIKYADGYVVDFEDIGDAIRGTGGGGS